MPFPLPFCTFFSSIDQTMRLLHAKTRKLVEFYDDAIPEYAILSHTWGADELTFRDIAATGTLLPSKKIDGCLQQALADELEYVWIDTICIDKSSSAELSEAINSMFAWYKSSRICYAYLSDVNSDCNTSMSKLSEPDSDFCRSKWFTRGWTLPRADRPQKGGFFQHRLAAHSRQVRH